MLGYRTGIQHDLLGDEVILRGKRGMSLRSNFVKEMEIQEMNRSEALCSQGLLEEYESYHHCNELSLREIQDQITEWGIGQFGVDNTSMYEDDPACNTPMGSLIQLCGVATEVSEIMRPVIEMHQGRWNKNLPKEERDNLLREALEDGAADLLIWLCHWAGLNEIDLQQSLNKVWSERVKHRKQKDWEAIKANED